MKKIREYIRQSWDELVNKVSWPTWPELQDSTIVVMIASGIIAVIIFTMDYAFQIMMGLLYKI